MHVKTLWVNDQKCNFEPMLSSLSIGKKIQQSSGSSKASHHGSFAQHDVKSLDHCYLTKIVPNIWPYHSLTIKQRCNFYHFIPKMAQEVFRIVGLAPDS